MNATPHTVIGYSMIKLAGGNPLGCLLAFTSHLVADYVNENGLKTTKQRILFDVLPTIILFIASYFYGGVDEAYKVFLGSVFGNLPDLIDKKGYFKYWYPGVQKSLPKLVFYLESKAKIKDFINWAMIPTKYLHFQKIIFNPKPIVVKWQGYAMVLIVLSMYYFK